MASYRHALADPNCRRLLRLNVLKGSAEMAATYSFSTGVELPIAAERISAALIGNESVRERGAGNQRRLLHDYAMEFCLCSVFL